RRLRQATPARLRAHPLHPPIRHLRRPLLKLRQQLARTRIRHAPILPRAVDRLPRPDHRVRHPQRLTLRPVPARHRVHRHPRRLARPRARRPPPEVLPELAQRPRPRQLVRVPLNVLEHRELRVVAQHARLVQRLPQQRRRPLRRRDHTRVRLRRPQILHQRLRATTLPRLPDLPSRLIRRGPRPAVADQRALHHPRLARADDLAPTRPRSLPQLTRRPRERQQPLRHMEHRTALFRVQAPQIALHPTTHLRLELPTLPHVRTRLRARHVLALLPRLKPPEQRPHLPLPRLQRPIHVTPARLKPIRAARLPIQLPATRRVLPAL